MLNELWSDRIKPLISIEEIDNRIKEIGKEISDKHTPNLNRLVMIGIMDGAGPFLFDLIKNIETKLELFTVKIKTYDGVYKSEVISSPLKELSSPNIKGANVIVVDDILDTGNTISMVEKTIRPLAPFNLEFAFLLNKNKTDRKPDYVGFNIPDEFVVGYGLDYKGFYRNLQGVFTYA